MTMSYLMGLRLQVSLLLAPSLRCSGTESSFPSLPHNWLLNKAQLCDTRTCAHRQQGERWSETGAAGGRVSPVRCTVPPVQCQCKASMLGCVIFNPLYWSWKPWSRIENNENEKCIFSFSVSRVTGFRQLTPAPPNLHPCNYLNNYQKILQYFLSIIFYFDTD